MSALRADAPPVCLRLLRAAANGLLSVNAIDTVAAVDGRPDPQPGASRSGATGNRYQPVERLDYELGERIPG